jgi:septal ring factor EnvC (AmiA/AmiB activator)
MAEPDDLTDLQKQKLEIEIAKLKAETNLLRRPWYLQAPYVAATLPIIAVCVTGWIAYSNSDFRRDAQAARNEVARLRPIADTLKQQVDLLQKEKSSLQLQRDSLLKEVKSLTSKSSALQQEIGVYNASVAAWRTQLLDISSRLKSKSFGGGGIQIFPPPNAEAERRLLQSVIDAMLSTIGPQKVRISSSK